MKERQDDALCGQKGILDITARLAYFDRDAEQSKNCDIEYCSHSILVLYHIVFVYLIVCWSKVPLVQSLHPKHVLSSFNQSEAAAALPINCRAGGKVELQQIHTVGSQIQVILQLTICFMSQFSFGYLTLPSVIVLISVLSYGSQLLFPLIDPGPLLPNQSWKFNALVACIWVSYFRACFTDPGWVPRDYSRPGEDEQPCETTGPQRWCRKCKTFKPPRAHHCKICSKSGIESILDACH